MTACTGLMGRECTCGTWHSPAPGHDARFMRCLTDPSRGSLCKTCTSPTVCSGMSDEVDARIREWELHRAARMGVCSHQVPEPEPTEGPGIAISRPAWIAGLASAAVLLAVIAAFTN